MNCAGKTDLFFDDARADYAKTLCNGCDGLLGCLERGLAYEEYGVWGGTTAEERVVIRQHRGITVRSMEQLLTPRHKHCGTVYGYQFIRRYAQWIDCADCKRAHAEYTTRKTNERKARTKA